MSSTGPTDSASTTGRAKTTSSARSARTAGPTVGGSATSGGSAAAAGSGDAADSASTGRSASPTKAAGPGRASGTRQRILDIARELFARQGFTGTSIADIAGELGTTTAALYYHFRSKADILNALLAEPMVAYKRIIETLESGSPSAEDLLGAFIDLTVDSRELAAIIDRDPAVLAMIDEQLSRTSEEMTQQVLAALAGPGADRASLIRANAAFSVIKGATMAALSRGGEPDASVLNPADRAEILGAALRALGRRDT
jgi:AcrR family transcriptional regulator